MLSHKKIEEKEVIPVILCAGEGTRYGKLTQNIPKPLIQLKPLKYESILSFLIKNLLSLHLKKIIIITGHLNEKIESSVNLLQKEKDTQANLILIHSGEQYKKGTLFSLLSIIQNKGVYVRNNYFVIFPGDTIFDLELLNEVFNFIYNNRELIFTTPCIFFQETYYDGNSKFNPRLVSMLELEDSKSEIRKVKEIKKIDLRLISKGQPINLVVPILVFSFEVIGTLLKLSLSNPVREIREILNIYSKSQNFVAIKLKTENTFFDIDTVDDLNYFKQKIKEKGGQ